MASKIQETSSSLPESESGLSLLDVVKLAKELDPFSKTYGNVLPAWKRLIWHINAQGGCPIFSGKNANQLSKCFPDKICSRRRSLEKLRRKLSNNQNPQFLKELDEMELMEYFIKSGKERRQQKAVPNIQEDAATTTSGVLKSVLAEVNKGTDEPVQESFEEKLKFLAKRHKKEQDHLMARLMLEKKLQEINSKSQ